MSKDSKIVPEHYQIHKIEEVEHFNAHGERKETHTFRNAKHELEKVEHQGCLVCGTHDSLESHHIVERASYEGSDLKKVAFYLFNRWDYHGHCHKDFKSEEELYKFLSDFNSDECLDSIYNQMILCKKHHRGEGTSAHGSSYATMCAILVAKDGFETSISPQELEERIKQHHVEKHGSLIIPVESKEE